MLETVNLVPIKISGKLKIDETLERDARYLLPEVHEMLHAAADSLPPTDCLIVFEAFRTQNKQFRMWNERIVEVALDAMLKELVSPDTMRKLRSCPSDRLLETYEMLKFGLARKIGQGANGLEVGAEDAESTSAFDWRPVVADRRTECRAFIEAIRNVVRDTIADPVDFPSGHQYGAAVDVTVLRADEPLDMGTGWAEFTRLTGVSDKVPTASEGITTEQRDNRAYLKDIMERAGFIVRRQHLWDRLRVFTNGG